CLFTLLHVSSCPPTNHTCLCADKTYTKAVTDCVIGNCTVKEGLLMKNFTVTQCDHYENATKSSLSVAFLVLFCIEAVFFLLRVLCRALKLSTGGWDDLSITIAFAGSVAMIVGRVLQGKLGMGRDIWTLTPDEITQFIKVFYVFGVIYAFTLGLIRMSICFLYLRLFQDEKVRRLIWATQIFNALVIVLSFIIYLLHCRPLSYYWTRWDGEHQGTCFNFSDMAYAHAGINISLDIWMLALPFWQIMKTEMLPRKKLQALVMFGCGIFLTIVSIMRLQSLILLANNTNPTKDFTWVATWSIVEITVGIIVACLPASRIIILRYLP
ncbi:hypothetical protein F5883DRAFT_351013, partial [Diaporthe sp. PMI_573]